MSIKSGCYPNPYLPDGCTSDDVDNAWGTQCPIDERDPDAWENEDYRWENENAGTN